MATHYNTHLDFPGRGGSTPVAHSIPTAARKSHATPVEVMMEHHLQALVFIINFVVNLLVLYHVHQSRLLESVD